MVTLGTEEDEEGFCPSGWFMATQVENKHLLPVAMVNAFSAESPVTTAAEIYQAVHDLGPLHAL